MHTELKLHRVAAESLLRKYVERRLNFALNRFHQRIGRMTVRIGPSDGKNPLEIACRVTAHLHPFGPVKAEATDPDIHAAIDRCIGRLARRCESKYARLHARRAGKISIAFPDSLPLAG